MDIDHELAPYGLVALAVALLVYLFYSYYASQSDGQPEVNYAFSASTKIRRRPPTILQFSARVPPGSEAMPTILQTADHGEVVHHRGIVKKEPQRPRYNSASERYSTSESDSALEHDSISEQEEITPKFSGHDLGTPVTPPQKRLVRSSSVSSVTSHKGGRVSTPRSHVVTSSRASTTPKSQTQAQGSSRSVSHSSQLSPARASSGAKSAVQPNKSRQRVTRSQSRALTVEAENEMEEGTMLKRHERAMRDSNKHTGNGERLYTTWFETQSSHTITAPPRLHPKCNVQLGDLFVHKHGGSAQLWLRVLDENVEEDLWKVVEVGYKREDGRRLTITPKQQIPSWVGGEWGTRRLSAMERK